MLLKSHFDKTRVYAVYAAERMGGRVHYEHAHACRSSDAGGRVPLMLTGVACQFNAPIGR